MSWKKSARNGNFSLHGEGQNCFFAAFSFYFPVFRRQEFTDRMLAVPASQVSPEEERSGGQAVPVCFRLVKKLSGCLFDFSGRRVRRLLGIEVASRGEWTILEGMGLTF